MHEKTRDIMRSYVAGRIDRRDLFKAVGKLGVGAAAASYLLNEASTQALAADFDWMAYKGKTINLLLNKHPYADAMIAYIDNFKKLTGMDVKYDVFPEDVYFDKVTAALSSGSSQYDAFMTGAYQTWQYGPAGWLVDMNEYLQDSSKTAPNYNWDGMLPNLRAATSWSGQPGAALGGEGAKQWALPWGFEVYALSYNQKYLDQMKAQPPKDLPSLSELAQKFTKDMKGVYGIGVRGSRSWATIHPGYLSAYTNYGAHDFTMEGGKLKAAMNSPQAKEMTGLWVKMIQEAGPRNWATYTWYQVSQDLGAGASAMMYDADIAGYFMNSGSNKAAGDLGYAAFTPNPKASGPTSNVWIWSLAMNANGAQKDAAWYFMQWATGPDFDLWGARSKDLVDPVRQTVIKDDQVRSRIQKGYPGYLETYEKTAPDAKIYFTPQPLFFNVTTDWAAALQKMVANQVPVDDGLDQLASNVDRTLKQAGLG